MGITWIPPTAPRPRSPLPVRRSRPGARSSSSCPRSAGGESSCSNPDPRSDEGASKPTAGTPARSRERVSAPRPGYASPPEQGGGWSAARRSLVLRVLAGRAVPGNRRALALRRSTAALRQIPEDLALSRTALPGTRALLPCPSPASSSQGGPSAARAGLRGRPGAGLRDLRAGTAALPHANDAS